MQFFLSFLTTEAFRFFAAIKCVCITVNQFSFRDLSEINWFSRTNFRDEGVDYLNNCFPETFKGKFAERKNFEPREFFFLAREWNLIYSICRMFYSYFHKINLIIIFSSILDQIIIDDLIINVSIKQISSLGRFLTCILCYLLNICIGQRRYIQYY